MTDTDDTPSMKPEDQARWTSARTLADLGELTTQFLEGNIEQTPAISDHLTPRPRP